MTAGEEGFIDGIVAPALRNGCGRELMRSLLVDAMRDGDCDKIGALQHAVEQTVPDKTTP